MNKTRWGEGHSLEVGISAYEIFSYPKKIGYTTPAWVAYNKGYIESPYVDYEYRDECMDVYWLGFNYPPVPWEVLKR